MLYNPAVHCYEMFRAGFFGDAQTTYYSAWYVGSWAFGLSCLGLLGIHAIRERIQFV